MDNNSTNGHQHESEGHHGPKFLHHHFENPQQQFDSDKLGMWLFLATEILMFGGLFCVYSIYRANHPEVFIYAHQFLDKTLGGINTLVLIASSVTMAWAVRAAQLNQIKLMRILLFLTLLGGCAFMGIKSVEYNHKWKHGLLWGTRYQSEAQREAAHNGHVEETSEHVAGESADIHNADPAMIDAQPDEGPSGLIEGGAPGEDTPPAFSGFESSKILPAPRGPAGLAAGFSDSPQPGDPHKVEIEPRNVQSFFAVYFAMTGLHGLHVLLGMFAISCLLVISYKGKLRIGFGSWTLVSVDSSIGSDYYTPVDLVGLFWHLIDLIWIFLFPLLYLIG